MTQVFPGQILGGKYRVDRVLGAGGMGMVVAATHLQLDERVAIKFLLPEALNNPEAVARFGREARAAVKIRGEHVARVTDVGAFESGVPYMVMEHLDGRDLSALLREHGALPPADAVDAVLQACEALAEAHALGIVHRDLKPANLFMTRRPDGTPSIKVLDFGISKVTNASASDNAMTRTASIMGSPLYMSPEQMTSSRDVDARTDIWAIGVVLYELLSGRVPFNGETLPEICGLILTVAPPPISHYSPSVPPALQAVLMRCLEKDRNRRYRNVSELAQGLAPFGSRATSRSVERISRILGTASPLDPVPASVGPAATGVAEARTGTVRFEPTQSNWGQTNPPSSSAMPLVVAGAAAVVLLGGALGGFLWWHSKSPGVEPSASASGQPAVAAVAPMVSVAPLVSPAAVDPTGAVVRAGAPSSASPAPSPRAVVTPNAKATGPHPTEKQPTAAKAPAAPAQAAVAPTPKAKRSAEDLLSGRN